MFQMEKVLFIVLLGLLSALQYGAGAYKVKSISTQQFEWAHNPFWDVTSQTLYFADIRGGTISSYKPSSKALHTANVVSEPKRHCSVIIPVKGEKDKFVVTIRNTVTNLTWDSTSSSTSKPVLVAEIGTNSSIHTLTGKADPMGRLWVGTVGPFNKKAQPEPKAGSEYMLTAGGKVVTKISDITTPDGLAWNSDKTKLYFVDAHEKKVEVFDFDNQSGDISNRRVIFDTKKNNLDGLPTGMTVDTEGKLWIAQFFDGKVIRIDPDSGELLREVSIPAKEVTNVVFGGENLDVLYVTSASIFKVVSTPTKFSGRVFAVTGLMNSGKPATGYPSQKITEI